MVGLLTEWARGNEMERRAAGGDLGGTMRLGAYPAILAEDLLVQDMYHGATAISERHRHRSRSTCITGSNWRLPG